MNLDAYLTENKITSLRFSKMVGASLAAVNKWRQRISIPRAKMLRKIEKLTKRKVTATDWY